MSDFRLHVAAGVKRSNIATDPDGSPVQTVALAADGHIEVSIETDADRLLNGCRIADRDNPPVRILAKQLLEDEGAVTGGAAEDVVAGVEQCDWEIGCLDSIGHCGRGIGKIELQMIAKVPEPI